MQSTYGCWYQSKKPTLHHIESYLLKIGKDPASGLSREELESVIDDLPSAARWVVNKIHGVEGVLKNCDTDNDNVIHMKEALDAKHCADSCWKQMALSIFL